MTRRIKRKYSFEYRIICYYCTTGEPIYTSEWSEASQEEEKDEDEWKTSFVIWVDRMKDGINDFLEKAARQKCSSYGRPATICAKAEMRGLEFEEEIIEEIIEVPVIPRDIQLRIERIQELIKEAETIDEKMALEEELKRLKERYGIK